MSTGSAQVFIVDPDDTGSAAIGIGKLDPNPESSELDAKYQSAAKDAKRPNSYMRHPWRPVDSSPESVPNGQAEPVGFAPVPIADRARRPRDGRIVVTGRRPRRGCLRHHLQQPAQIYVILGVVFVSDHRSGDFLWPLVHAAPCWKSSRSRGNFTRDICTTGPTSNGGTSWAIWPRRSIRWWTSFPR